MSNEIIITIDLMSLNRYERKAIYCALIKSKNINKTNNLAVQTLETSLNA